MADGLTITMDPAPLVQMLDDLGTEAEALLKEAAKETAENIAREARARVARATGQTAAGITVEESHDGTGYAVVSSRRRMPSLPRWLELGTVSMDPRPYFDVSAELEQGPHFRRVSKALADALEKANR